MADIKGAKELSRKLSELGAATGGKALRSATMAAALPALRQAQAAAPMGNPPYPTKDGREVDPYPKRTYRGRLTVPGFLRRNLRRVSSLSEDRTKARVVIGPRAEAFYGQFLEFGTSSIPRQPWLEPSFRSSIPEMTARLQERLKALIDKAAK